MAADARASQREIFELCGQAGAPAPTASPSGSSRPSQTASLTHRKPFARQPAQTPAPARQRARVERRRRARLRRPNLYANASFASIQRPVMQRSSARPKPRRRAAVCVPATPGIMPAPVSGRQMRVSSAAIAMSHSSSHLEAAADREAMDRGDGRNRQRAQPAPHVAPKTYPSRDRRRGRAAEFAHVAAGGKRRARARQHHRAHLGVVMDRAEDFEEIVAHRHVVGIELARPIERYPCDPVALGEPDRAEARRRR